MDNETNTAMQEAARQLDRLTGPVQSWRRLLPLSFITLSLFALVLLPLLVRRQTQSLREEMAKYVGPAGQNADDFLTTFSEELSLIVAFQATEQQQFQQAYQDAVTREAQELAALQPLAPRIGSEFQSRLTALQSAQNEWHAKVATADFVRRSLPSPVFLYQLFEANHLLSETLSAAEALKKEARAAMAERQEAINAAEQRNVRISLTLTFLALISALLVAWLGRRMRLLAEEAQTQRAEALRETDRANEARAAAEAAEKRAAFLADASRELTSTLDPQAILARVCRLSVPQLADFCLIDDVSPDGQVCRAALAHRKEAKEAWLDQPGESPSYDALPLIRDVISNPRMILLNEVPEELRNRLGRADRVNAGAVLEPQSLMIVPLIARQQITGLMILAAAESRRQFTEVDLQMGQELALRAALARDNARLYSDSQQAVRSREEILAIVSHDLRSPLTTISVTTSMIMDMPIPPEEIPEHLGVIRTSAKQMSRLITDLLEVTRIDSGHRLPIDPEPIEAGQFISEVVNVFRPQAKARKIRLISEVPQKSMVVEGDHDRLVQALSNLVGNALKFTPEGGTVSLAVRAEDSSALFSVSDTGPGIEEENKHSIFEPYWQMKRTARLGAGLGLPIAKGIIEAHGGQIRVESNPGEGTTFFFTVPLKETAVPSV